ncbi:hypothetical protein E6C60_0631 [Paenibacillus algicola]|uniref:Uncharacterized protein n=1 Tax=Paenibacillus algicola TaxID=2565926 RepID=A0A4P8XGT5_9BACL|nr:hypothetical protein E6C60_0631 [Paenibacillus algicola]
MKRLQKKTREFERIMWFNGQESGFFAIFVVIIIVRFASTEYYNIVKCNIVNRVNRTMLTKREILKCMFVPFN